MTTEVELNAGAELVGRDRPSRVIETRIWCFDCYDRREPWVLRSLATLGVEFRHAVLEDEDVCRSCKAQLRRGTHAIVLTIPVGRPADAPPSEESA